MRLVRTLSAAVLMALAAAAPIHAAPRISGAMGEAPAAQAAISASLLAALNRINELRSQAGVPALTFNAQLKAAAKGHADDMAAKGYFSHTSQDGRTPGQRIAAAGYSYSAYGETIAIGYDDWAAAIAGWMGSPGHRAILLGTRYRDIGLGRKDRYYVADLASPRG
jgi:uncharacterized protein YkwD